MTIEERALVGRVSVRLLAAANCETLEDVISEECKLQNLATEIMTMRRMGNVSNECYNCLNYIATETAKLHVERRKIIKLKEQAKDEGYTEVDLIDILYRTYGCIT